MFCLCFDMMTLDHNFKIECNDNIKFLLLFLPFCAKWQLPLTLSLSSIGLLLLVCIKRSCLIKAFYQIFKYYCYLPWGKPTFALIKFNNQHIIDKIFTYTPLHLLCQMMSEWALCNRWQISPQMITKWLLVISMFCDCLDSDWWVVGNQKPLGPPRPARNCVQPKATTPYTLVTKRLQAGAVWLGHKLL